MFTYTYKPKNTRRPIWRRWRTTRWRSNNRLMLHSHYLKLIIKIKYLLALKSEIYKIEICLPATHHWVTWHWNWAPNVAAINLLWSTAPAELKKKSCHYNYHITHISTEVEFHRTKQFFSENVPGPIKIWKKYSYFKIN